MKTRAIVLSALGIAALAVAVLLTFWQSAPHVSGPLRQEAYVWQHAWTKPVQDAVSQRATNFAALCVLKAEVSWNNKKPHVARVALDYPLLSSLVTNGTIHVGRADLPVGQNAKQHGPTVGIALRIGPYPGPFGSNDPITIFLTDLAASLVAEAQTHHLNLSELQIDFDCAESKLDGYREWVEAIQRRVAALPVTITALPSWLGARAFRRLAAVATNYVLQVHSIAHPRNFNTSFTLCDPRAARRAVERAGRIGVPFRVALPTYGYTLAFDQTGKFIGLSAEGPRPNWPTNAQLREVRSDPVEMAALVRQWTDRRPAAMRGVIWFRFPVATDKFNWDWPTLRNILDAPVSVSLRGKKP